ncbi:unnamed protein product [Pelagomonas calceolata]|uniref:U-box domain-containing protein n=1 Tax=Pelagomonas calceolata TaxID=35677 RepID=A0A8J2WWT7_9STRA|nr:unnamed protein product [Pelagomonas calceolata]
MTGSSAARGKAKKLVTDDLLDVAKHQSVLEETLRAHRAEIARLQIGRDELPSKFYCCITTEVMSDPCMAADGHTYERCAIDQWFATGARTSPTTNEPLASLQLIPNHALRAMIVEELERRGGHAS